MPNNKMKDHFQFRSHLAADGEILSHHTLFLPPGSPPTPRTGEIYTPKMQHFAAFLPVFQAGRKDLTAVAQPLLKEDLR